MAADGSLEQHTVCRDRIGPQARQDAAAEGIRRLVCCCCQKRGDAPGYGGFRKILGTKIHAAADSDSLPVSVAAGPADEHGPARLAGAMDGVSGLPNRGAKGRIVSVHADRGYDAERIRKCPAGRGIRACIPHRNFGTGRASADRHGHDRTRYAVERLFARLKCGFRRTATRYGRTAGNYLALLSTASVMTYWRVLG